MLSAGVPSGVVLGVGPPGLIIGSSGGAAPLLAMTATVCLPPPPPPPPPPLSAPPSPLPPPRLLFVLRELPAPLLRAVAAAALGWTKPPATALALLDCSPPKAPPPTMWAARPLPAEGIPLLKAPRPGPGSAT